MTQISSDATQVYKRALPVILPLFCLLFVAIAWGYLGPVIIAAVVFPAAFFLWHRTTVVPLADEVWEDGDCVRVRRREISECIKLEDITELEGPNFSSLRIATLRFGTPNQFGNSVTFIPKGGLENLFLRNSVMMELERQICLARLLKESEAAPGASSQVL